MNWENIKNLDPSMPEWEELDKLNRRLSFLQNVYVRDFGVSAIEARETASAEEGIKLGWSAQEVESACAYYRGAKARFNRTENGGEPMTEAPLQVTEKSRQNGTNSGESRATLNGTFKDFYRAWCTFSDYIPTDKFWPFAFNSSSTIGYSARAELRKEGYEFAKAEHDGWIVTVHPKPKPVMSDEERALLAALLKKASEAGLM